MRDERLTKKIHTGVVGITDTGQPIVTALHTCPLWDGSGGLSTIKECWYCQYADFRKTCDMTLSTSICRHPKNTVNIEQKNERGEIK